MNKTVLMCACSLFMVGLGGCSDGNTQSSGNTETKVIPPSSPTPVEITVYSAPGDSEEAWNERYGNPIKKKFPYVTIKYINPRGNDSLKLDVLLNTGVSIDLYYESIGSFFSTMPQYKMQLDHTDLVKKHNVDLNLFEPSLIDALKTNGAGQMWGLPVNNNNLVLYYNKDIFDHFGVPHLKDGMTWDEVIEISKKFNKNENGKQYVGLIVSPNHILNMNQYSLPYADPKTGAPSISDKKWNEIWKKLFQTSFLDPANESAYKAKIEQLGNKLPYANEWQKTYEAAMYIHQSNLPFINEPEFSAMNFDMVSLPTFKDLPGVGGQMYPTYFSVTSMSKQTDTAFQIIKYLTSPEYQLEYSKKGLMPVLKDESYKKVFATETSYKGKNINFGAVFYNKPAAIAVKSLYDPIVRSAVTSKLVDLSLGKTDLNTALRVAEEEAVKNIQSMKK